MRSRVYVTIERPYVRPSVRPSVCLSHRSTAATPVGAFAAERLRTDDGVGERRAAGTPALGSRYGQCHVDSRRTRLNTDLFYNANSQGVI